MRFICCIVLIFCCFFNTISGQNPDSLKVLFFNEKNEEKKVEYALAIVEKFDATPVKIDSILPYVKTFEDFIESHPKHALNPKVKYFIGASYYLTDTARMFSILEEVSNEAIVLKDTVIFAKALIQRASKLRVLSKPYKANELLTSGMQFIEGSNSDTGRYYRNRFSSLMSTNYINLGQFEDALKYALIAESMAIKSNDEELLLRAYFNLGRIYGELCSEEKQLVSKVERERYKVLAHDIMVKSYNLCQGKPMSRMSGISTYNLGVFYSIDSQYVKSKIYLKEAIRIGIELPYKELLFNAYDVVSEDYLIEGKLDSAEIYINRIEKLADELQYPFHQISAGFTRGKYYLLNNQYEKARSTALFYLKFAQDNDLIDKERTLYNLLYEIEEKAGNYKLALAYFKQKEALAKQIAGDESIQKIELLQAQFNHEKQKNQIEKLEKEKYLQELKITRKNRLIGLAILLGLLLSIFIYYKNRERVILAEKKNLAAQQKLLRMQLNPHFLFNTLNSIQQFIYQKKEPKIVADYLSKFSQLVRRILQNSKEDFITLGVEIDFLTDYMDLQQLRFDTPFKYKINVDENLEVNEVLIPPMFTQPFVENSIEHGNLEKISEGIIEIDFLEKNGILEIIIKDNGVGIDKTQFKLKNDKHRSLATKITYERLKAMKPKMKMKSKLEIIDLSNLDNKITGTQVILNLPLLYK
jgi:tetratricopeptide (TPR) repeat protein